MCKNVVKVLFFIVSLILFIPSSSAQQNAEIEITLRPRLPSFGNETAILIDFIITNRSNSLISVLGWNTPINRVASDFLIVVRGSQPIQYVGPLVKRGEPTAGDFVALEPGQSVEAVIDLASYYAVYEAGQYTVTYDTENASLLIGSPDNLIPARVVSNAATFNLLAGRIPPIVPISDTKFEECNSTQQDDINMALPEASAISESALAALQNLPFDQQPNSQRYVTWFGVHTDGLYTKVTGNFAKISDALANKVVSFGCNGSECKPGDYAYVFPNQPYRIYVCEKFWSAALQGTDSRSGTIVHEISHFGVVSATKDYAYGQSGAKTLAVDNPPRATSNADSHEYFSENSPELPM